MDGDRLTMPLGEAIFTQRSTRKLKQDPIPEADIRLILEAAVKAPNGGNHQTGRFLVVTDRARIREFGALYREAWWAKRKDDHGWSGPQDIPPGEKNYNSAMGLADDMKDVPCVIFAMTEPSGGANSIRVGTSFRIFDRCIVKDARNFTFFSVTHCGRVP